MKSYKTLREEGHGFFKIVSYVVIIAFLISIFVIGSLSTMLGKNQVSFITVDGKEIMTKSLVELVSQKIKDKKNKLQIQYTVFREAQPFINRELILSEFHDQKLYPKVVNLVDTVEELYNKEKRRFEKTQNTRYPYSLEDFIKIYRDKYCIEVFDSLTKINYIDKSTVKREYRLEHIKARVKYYVLDFKDYIKNIKLKEEDIKRKYEEVKSKFLKSIEARYLLFNTFEKANKFAEEIKNKKKNIEKAFKNSLKACFKPKDTKEFFKIKATPLHEVTDPFSYKNKYAVALIEKINYVPYENLPKKDKQEIKNKIINSQRKRYFNQFRKYAKTLLSKTNIDEKKVTIGTTEPFSILGDEYAKTEKGEEIKWASPENKDFFREAFTKEGHISPIKEWGDYIYRIKVLKIEMPNTISEQEKETMLSRLKEREKRRFEWGFLQDLRKKFKIKYNWERIFKLFGVGGK